jgi:flagellar biogenesis protein FliO
MSHLAGRLLPLIIGLWILPIAEMRAAGQASIATTDAHGSLANTPRTTSDPHLPLRFDRASSGPATRSPAPPPAAGPEHQRAPDAAADDVRSPSSIPFPPRGAETPYEGRSARSGPVGGTLTTVAGSLGLVLVVFFVFAWATRRTVPQRLAQLPSEAVESLGRVPLAGRQQMHLVRVGSKLLLLSVTSNEARTLTEITDPAEVDRLSGLCQQTKPGSVTSSFHQVLSEASQPPRNRTRRQRTSRRAAEGSHV